MAKSYVSLSLNEKVRVIEAKEKDKLSVSEIMVRFKCRKTQIYNTLKHKDKIMNDWLQGNGQMKRKAKLTGNEEINAVMWEWFASARSKNLQISGPMLQSEALAVAKSLGNDQFKASTGWLDSFKKRHNIVWNEICGESKDVNESVVNEWKTKLQDLIADYEPKNIYNADETGLFFRALPTKSLTVKGEKCAGGKMSKERLTVLLCGNLAGNMVKPVVIGKAAKPRCFKNFQIENLPVIWRNNKKAWMTAATMEEWLNGFNAQMIKEKRKAILFLDNATCHPHITLSNVKLAWFPPNATSVLQPMDMGIIYTFKSYYRRFLMQSLILNVEVADSSYDLARSVSILDAVNWIGLAIKQIKTETITKCFAKAGFGESDGTDEVREASENEKAISNLCRDKNMPCSSDDFIRSDDHLATHHHFESATDLLAIRTTENEEEEEEDGDEEEAARGSEVQTKIRTHEEALQCIRDVMQFAAHSNSSRLLELLYSVNDCIQSDMVNKKWKQVSLSDFWKKSE